MKHDLPLVPRRGRDGRRKRNREAKATSRQRDPQRAALEARCVQMGWPNNRHYRERARHPMLECPVGQAIFASGWKDAGTLWEAWRGYAAARRAYLLIVIGSQPNAQGSMPNVVREPMEAGPDDRQDDRTLEERHQDVSNRHSEWRERVGRMHSKHAKIILQLSQADGAPLHEQGRLTKRGKRALEALEALAEQVKRP